MDVGGKRCRTKRRADISLARSRRSLRFSAKNTGLISEEHRPREENQVQHENSSNQNVMLWRKVLSKGLRL